LCSYKAVASSKNNGVFICRKVNIHNWNWVLMEIIARKKQAIIQISSWQRCHQESILNFISSAQILLKVNCSLIAYYIS
jgi:hypothetical protein